jgi:nitroimidazol reductase NimA-like FMN-containing flavoprotein (pyridoxamine 5'-phosphate oxidase superfamily)
MAVTMTDDAIWALLTDAERGVFVSLRSSGEPIALPVWFIAHEQRIFVRTPAKSKKVTRVRHDERVSFLVDDGHRWADLRGVHISGTAHVVEDAAVIDLIDGLIATKYEGLRTAETDRPDASNRHYASRTLSGITPTKILSWDNGLLRGVSR